MLKFLEVGDLKVRNRNEWVKEGSFKMIVDLGRRLDRLKKILVVGIGRLGW